MNHPLITRRQALGGLVAAPLVPLAGCDSYSGPIAASSSVVPGSAIPAAPGSVVSAPGNEQVTAAPNPVMSYFIYGGYGANQPQTVQPSIPNSATGVTTTSDRFGREGACYEYDGRGSSVLVEGVSGFPIGDYALLVWVQSADPAPAQFLRIGVGDDTALQVGTGEGGNLTISGTTVAPFGTPQVGGFPSITDGGWHHIVVQKYGTTLQVFVDGIPFSWPYSAARLPTNSSVLIGAGWSGAIDTLRLYDRAFPAASIPQAVYQWASVKASTSPATDNLFAYYPFYGNAASYLGNGVDGVVTNAALTTDRNGSSAAAYLFNGVNACITLTPQFESLSGDFALAFWARSDSTAQMTAFGATSGGVAGSSLDFVLNGGAALQVYINGVAVPGLGVGANGGLTDGNWHCVLLQRSGSELQLYVDATLAASVTNTAIFFGSTSIIYFGRGSGASADVSQYWNGSLDDVQFYENALTPTNIAALQKLAYLGRDGVGGLSFQGKLWLLGGWNPSFTPDTNSEVWSSTDGLNWTLVTIAPWERRHNAGYVVFDDKMWIVGGDRETGHYQNDVWCSSDGVNWQEVTASVPWANRATQYVLEFDEQIWLMGGQQIFETGVPPGPVVGYNDVWSSVDGATWRQVTAAAPWSPRGLIMGSVVYQNRMWVIGGGEYDIRTFNNDVWNSADGVNWTQVQASAPWSPRQYQNIVVFDNKIWVLAGGDGAQQGGLNDVWYSIDGVQWTQLAGAPWTLRHAATTIVQGGFMYLTGGTYSFPNDDVWKLGYAN
jgi:concanavalin A-like lectin/glucanase superfamily protein